MKVLFKTDRRKRYQFIYLTLRVIGKTYFGNYIKTLN